MSYRQSASWVLQAMLWLPLLICAGIALGVLVGTVTARAGERCGIASWYGAESGGRTASGERFNPRGLSIAMRSYAFGRQYRVTYRGRSVVVRHNDFGPAARTGRQFDLSRGAAKALRLLSRGTGKVCVSLVSRAPS